MKAICNFCTHQKQEKHRRGVVCGMEEGGFMCVYNEALYDHFSARTGDEISVQNMVSVIARQDEKLMLNRERIASLEKRLFTVDGESK